MNLEFQFWTALPPLPLREVGTSRVESIEHYLHRQAFATGLGYDRTLDFANRWSGSNAFSHHERLAFTVTGVELGTRIGLIEVMTGRRDLHCGSLWVVSDAMGLQGFGRLTSARRWCPRCYLDWEKDTSAEALVWSIQLLETCPVHGCALVTACAACGATQSTRTPLPRRRHCIRCRTPLGWDAPDITARQTRFERWIDYQICSLVALCADPAQPKLASDSFTRYFHAFLKCHGARTDLPTALQAVVRVWKYGLGMKGLSMRMLLNFAALHGCSVLDLLLYPTQTGQSEPIFGFWDGFDYAPLVARSVRSPLAVLESTLRHLIKKASINYLPPLPEMLRRTECVQTDVKRIMPALLVDYKRVYEQQGTLLTLRRLSTAFAHASRELDALGRIRIGRSYLPRIQRMVAISSGTSAEDTQRACETALLMHRVGRKVASARQTMSPAIAEHARWEADLLH